MKKLFAVLILNILFVCGYSQTDYDKQMEFFANDLSKKIPSSKKKIAVVEFRNNDENITQFTKLISEDLSSEIAILANDKNQFEVVERNNLKTILNDLKLSSTRDEAKIARELGKKAVADVLVTGIVTLFGDNYRISIKVLDTENGNIITASKGLVVKTNALEDLHSKIIGQSTGSEKSIGEVSSSNSKGVEEQPKSNATGWIEIDNRSWIGYIVYVSTEQAVQYRQAIKFEEVYVANGTTEKMPSMKPGVYYICAVTNRNDDRCAMTKKIEVVPNAPARVILQ